MVLCRFAKGVGPDVTGRLDGVRKVLQQCTCSPSTLIASPLHHLVVACTRDNICVASLVQSCPPPTHTHTLLHTHTTTTQHTLTVLPHLHQSRRHQPWPGLHAAPPCRPLSHQQQMHPSVTRWPHASSATVIHDTSPPLGCPPLGRRRQTRLAVTTLHPVHVPLCATVATLRPVHVPLRAPVAKALVEVTVAQVMAAQARTQAVHLPYVFYKTPAREGKVNFVISLTGHLSTRTRHQGRLFFF